ncbi:MAG TPA: hypothetical protein VGN57_03660 [Pirellulaceae bacterium]|jgi:4-amino-4-deoxy-L-arabinose transferase-like glycosyltransferase|nr:hypothetical protein [Pirellulaceae bacterium]
MLVVLLSLISIVCSIVSIICFIFVIVQMFRQDDTGLALLCLLTVLCGIGGLLAFVLGWINVDKYDVRPVMIAWTIVLALGIVTGIAVNVLAPEENEFEDFGSRPVPVATVTT